MAKAPTGIMKGTMMLPAMAHARRNLSDFAKKVIARY